MCVVDVWIEDIPEALFPQGVVLYPGVVSYDLGGWCVWGQADIGECPSGTKGPLASLDALGVYFVQTQAAPFEV